MQTTPHLIVAELTGALLTVRINTQDSRVGIYAVELQDGNRRQTSIDWPFGVSDQPTVEVQLELAGAGREISTQVISGTSGVTSNPRTWKMSSLTVCFGVLMRKWQLPIYWARPSSLATQRHRFTGSTRNMVMTTMT